MANLGVVDGGKFFENMYNELYKSKSYVKYNLIREVDKINFYSYSLYSHVFYESTIVNDDKQFKNYYDYLSFVFTGDFEEKTSPGLGDLGDKLMVFINGKEITISSDNECDDWINDIIYAKTSNHVKTI